MVECRGSGVGSLWVVLAVLVLPACGGLGDRLLGGDNAAQEAHAVFLTRDGCSYFVTNQTRDQFAVLAPRGSYAPRQGDLLVGNLRSGEIGLEVVPFAAQEITRSARFEVAGHGLTLAEAQRLYYGFCPLPPDTAGVF